MEGVGMTTRATVEPELLVWARKRAGIRRENLVKKFPKLPDWERGEARPTYAQLDAFARTVYVPSGYLFLKEPPVESLPIEDFRTFASKSIEQPSPNLLDMVHICQDRQDWYRGFMQGQGEKELPFVGSATLETPPEIAASEIREAIGFDLAARRQCRTWNEALRLFVRNSDDAGILTMVSGVVLSNNKRRLDPEEFRGFALTDPFAPLVFINGADTKAAQMFTLAHELGHIWLGNSGLSNMEIAQGSGFRREEIWCNAVAAEILVPLSVMQDEIGTNEMLDELKVRLARKFKVSSLVILRRLRDAGRIGRTEFEIEWKRENAFLRGKKQRKRTGGDFRLTTLVRVGRRFAWALVTSTKEGQTLYRDAFRLLGISKPDTFDRIGREVGVTG